MTTREHRIYNISYPEGGDLRRQVEANYPWAVRLGLIDFVADMIRDDASPEEIHAAIRQTPEWRAQFPGFYAEDGSKRFSNEAEYMRYVDDIRDVLKEFGYYDATQEAPLNYLGWIKAGVDPNELRNRFEMYRDLEAGSKELRDAFYLYAGLEVSVDDMYRAVVDPSYQNEMMQRYDRAVAQTPLDYETYITRAAELATRDLADAVGAAVDQGIVPGSMLRDVINIDPNVARGWLDVLQAQGAQGPGRQDTPYLSFDELNTAFQYAVLASAASERGLALPDRDRLAEFVQAGVSRAAANRAYSTFATQRFGLAGMAARARVREIDQTLFEEAALLGDAEAGRVIQKAQGLEDALGQAGGGFAQSLEGERVVQRGR